MVFLQLFGTDFPFLSHHNVTSAVKINVKTNFFLPPNRLGKQAFFSAMKLS